jgi:hypothetical protein
VGILQGLDLQHRGGRGITTPHRKKKKKNYFVTKCYTGVRNLAGCCEHGNEPSGSIKGEEFFD